jgi:hypothetical protein
MWWMRRDCCRLSRLLSLFSILGVFVLVSGCTQTLRQQYITSDDPCSPAREPIVKVGDDLDEQQKQLARQQGAEQMKGHELPVTTETPYGTQFNWGNLFANAIHQASLTNQAYIKLKQQQTGANAAAMLASVEGDASSDNARMRSVTHAMSALRSCRQTQIVAAQGSTGTEAERLEKLRKQQTELNRDDELIGKVFGQYATRAQVYADASAASGASSHGVHHAKGSHNSVDAFKADQHTAQIADRKQSETLHETLQNSITGA